MNKFDKIFLSVILYPILPICFFLASWWISLCIDPKLPISFFALLGLFVGILCDVFWAKKWIGKAYLASSVFSYLIYLFYSIGLFGFFMGVPVFNIFLGIPLGIYVARQARVKKLTKEQFNKNLKSAELASVLYMLLICISSATVALVDPYTASGLKGMLGLPFEVTRNMVFGIILVGGTGLVVGQYFVTKFSGRIMYEKK